MRRSVLVGVLLCGTLAAIPCRAQSCGPWSRIGAEPPFGGASLNSVTHGDGMFVAVGDGGLVVTSPDGVAWTRRDSGETQKLRGVTWSGSRFVAVGDGGVIIVSDDAASWRNAAVECDQVLLAVTWSGSHFIAVGDNATILRSGDGEDWQTVTTGSEVHTLRSVACGGGVCVAGGSFLWTNRYASVMYRSTDGVEWHYAYAGDYANDLAWTGDRFVAAGSVGYLFGGAVASSEDGVDWTFEAPGVPGYEYKSLVSTPGGIVVFGDPEELLVSPDGLAWTARASALGSWVNDAVWADGRWVAVGQQGQTAVSDDGVSWSLAAPALFDSFSGRPAATNGSVIVAAAGKALYRSVDRVAWHRDASAGTSRVELFQAFGGGFVGRTPDGFASSPDGVTWTEHPLAPPDPAIYENISGMACSPTRCVAVGSEMLTSDDAVEWSRSALPAGRQLFDVAWTGSRFVALGLPASGSDALFLESTDGLVWESRTQYGLAAPTSLAAHGARVVAIGGGQGYIYTATGGLVFTDLVLPSYDDLRAVVWTGSYFAALGRKSDMVLPALWVSGDGTTWSEVAVPAGYDLRGVFGVGPRLYLFGERGTILSTSCSGYATSRALSRHLHPHR